jgi:hypothetical protein
MASDQIQGEWLVTPVRYEGVNLWPEQQTGYACGGLVIVGAYDDEGGFWPDSWAIWHQASGLDLLEVRASLERTMEIAGHLANMVDWQRLPEPDWVENDILRMQLQAFAAGYPELAGNSGLMMPNSDLDTIVPYRGDVRPL